MTSGSSTTILTRQDPRRLLVVEAQDQVLPALTAHLSALTSTRITLSAVRTHAEALAAVETGSHTADPIVGVLLAVGPGEGRTALASALALLKADPRLSLAFVGLHPQAGLAALAQQLGGRERFHFVIHPMPCQQAQDLALTMALRWPGAATVRPVYTVLVTRDGVAVVPVMPSRVTDRALLFEDGITLPNGQTRQMLRPDVDTVPDSPWVALDLYIAAQHEALARLERELAATRDHLAQAQRLRANEST